MTKKTEKRLLNSREFILAILGLVLVLAPYLWLSQYAHPAADDYGYATDAREMGYSAANEHWFNHGNSRFGATAILTLHPLLHGGLEVYRMMPYLWVALLALGFYTLISTATGQFIPLKQRLVATLGLTSLALFQMPNLAEGLYWMPGAVTYLLPASLMLFYLALLVGWAGQAWLFHKVIHLGLMILLLIGLTGFSEVVVLYLLVLHALISMGALLNRNRNRWEALTFLALSIAGLVLLLAADGNQARADQFEAGGRLWKSAGFTVMQSFRFLFDWLSSLPLWIATLLAFPWVGRMFPEASRKPPWGWTLALVLVIPLAVFPAYWGTGILGQHRTLNLAWIIFLPLWFAHLGAWLAWYRHTQGTETFTISPKVRNWLFLALILAMTVTRNGYSAFTDVFYDRTTAFDKQMTDRYMMMGGTGTSGANTVYVFPLVDPPKSLFVIDLQSDPDHWINQLWASYYGINAIVFEPAQYPSTHVQ